MDDPKDITTADLLGHMQGMEQRLTEKIDAKADASELEAVEQRLTKRMDSLEKDVAVIKEGVENIDRRLDAIELEELPKRVGRIEQQLQAA